MGQRKFVFRELVQNKRDVFQLISYAFYKSHKDERAEYFTSLHPPDSIPQKLQEWHDGIVSDPTALENYRTASRELVSKIEIEARSLAMIEIKQQHKDEIKKREEVHQFETEQLKQRVTDADIIAQQKWITKISSWAKDHNERKGFRKIIVNVFIWIGGSISGGLGSLLIILVIGGIAAVCSPDTRKAANSALKHAVDFVLPEKVFKTGINPPINNTPASDNMSATAE